MDKKNPRDMTAEELHNECNFLVTEPLTEENVLRHNSLEAELDRRNMFKE